MRFVQFLFFRHALVYLKEKKLLYCLYRLTFFRHRYIEIEIVILRYTTIHGSNTLK